VSKVARSASNWAGHAEALSQNVFGMLIAFCVMHAFGVHPQQAIPIQVTLFFTSYVRSYLIRNYFKRFD
jgi:hypothetical protein